MSRDYYLCDRWGNVRLVCDRCDRQWVDIQRKLAGERDNGTAQTLH